MATRPAWVNDELFPFESRFADVGGAQVHYIDEGEGPVLPARASRACGSRDPVVERDPAETTICRRDR